MRKRRDSLAEEMLYQLQSFEESTKELLKLSEPMEGSKDVLSGKEAEFIYTAVTEDVCRKCPKYRNCYGEKRERTLSEISLILEKANKETKVVGWMASEDFRRNCVYYQPFIEELSWLYRMLYQNYCWERQMEYMGEALRGQLRAQYLIIKECRRLLSEGEFIRGTEKRKLSFAMLRCGIHFLEGQKYVDEAGSLCINVTVQPLTGHGKPSDVAGSLSNVYHKIFQGSLMERRLHSGSNRLSFVEDGCFQILFGSSRRSKNGEKICGDTFSFIKCRYQRAFMLLSDGMGVGEQAFRDSKKLMDVFESMIEAGIHEEFVLQILHNILLQRREQGYSTLDAAILSMQTGMVKILKAGGAATFVRHESSVERILPKSMPPGSMVNQPFDIYHKKLYDGDMVIMVSDGMLDFENLPDVSVYMETYIKI
ncbi:MAG: SpoIIE family protein phosphatase [Clostridiales bacterium]|nr:SpoIIE family protein phosphatase [Clostridiales bacterium]